MPLSKLPSVEAPPRPKPNPNVIRSRWGGGFDQPEWWQDWDPTVAWNPTYELGTQTDHDNWVMRDWREHQQFLAPATGNYEGMDPQGVEAAGNMRDAIYARQMQEYNAGQRGEPVTSIFNPDPGFGYNMSHEPMMGVETDPDHIRPVVDKPAHGPIYNYSDRQFPPSHGPSPSLQRPSNKTLGNYTKSFIRKKALDNILKIYGG